jgi:hypothetical protein
VYSGDGGGSSSVWIDGHLGSGGGVGGSDSDSGQAGWDVCGDAWLGGRSAAFTINKQCSRTGGGGDSSRGGGGNTVAITA